ncbi:MAG: 4-hydroxy-tetrahydrodipicolinate synthase [candidate division WOR-3 bacterium]|nr:4-hydroxy-tetrahydrodipicolinate synthase [candidate division WOR-3 bacterium]MCX7757623.1 4-hydroxy-tetrahydrodipicolinate synthase [candidate division WOR-3 bacterium]MDW7987605.1 4-hydroxy-tetrahydrodipicolinate synthase [candidate division WOR-3 bacterium]
MKFFGSIVALVTPFDDNNKVDLEALKENIKYQLRNGTDGFVPCGTTGEAPTLTTEEWEAIVKTTVETVKRQKPVIAGAGTNSTTKTIQLVSRAKELGADGCLVVCPYYNRPTQDGLYEHFKAIAESVDLPLIIYNIPARTGVNILPVTVVKLYEKYPKIIVGIKEASGNLDQISEIRARCGRDFLIFSGDDILTLPVLAIGGDGVISVVANIYPKEMSMMIKHFFNGEIEKALALHYKLYPISKAMFIETNPAPVKFAMSYLGMKAGKPRLPLVEISEANKTLIKNTIDNYQSVINDD